MFCIYCGTKLSDDSRFCNNCGNAQTAMQLSVQEQKSAIPSEIEKTINSSSDNADTYSELGKKYYLGTQDVPIDETTARKLFEKAAEYNDAMGIWGLAACYLDGVGGLPKDEQKALELCKEAINLGSVDAMRLLGFMYSNGRGVTQNYTEAINWYRRTADQGDASGQTYLGWMYECGCGVPQSDTEAMAWYRKAAEQGHPEAQYRIFHLSECSYSVRQIISKTEADKWLYEAAKNGLAIAQYAYGEKIKQDSRAEAVMWFKKAAEQGLAQAAYVLGNMYANGRYVNPYADPDDIEAYRWYLKAANLGLVIAQNQVGELYEQGRGVKRNYSEAVAWYLKAIRQGDTRKIDNLKCMYNHGIKEVRYNPDVIACKKDYADVWEACDDYLYIDDGISPAEINAKYGMEKSPYSDKQEFRRSCKKCGFVWYIPKEKENQLLKKMKFNNRLIILDILDTVFGNNNSVSHAETRFMARQANNEFDRLGICPRCGSSNFYQEND